MFQPILFTVVLSSDAHIAVQDAQPRVVQRIMGKDIQRTAAIKEEHDTDL